MRNGDKRNTIIIGNIVIIYDDAGLCLTQINGTAIGSRERGAVATWRNVIRLVDFGLPVYCRITKKQP